MKANELMIGDWVYGLTEDDERVGVLHRYPCKVSEISQNGDICTEGGKRPPEFVEDIDCFWYNFDPIPITPVILEKNGWKREFDERDYMVKYDLAVGGKNCWMMWAVKEHNLDIQRQDGKLDMYNLKVSRVVIPCDYVHELQHALRLCGIDKEINL